MKALVAALGLLISTPALADAPAIANTFGFDYMKPKRACKKVSGSLLKKLKRYTCEKVEPGSTASGKDAVADCKPAKGSGGFLLFATQADCNEERETQLANGD
jgi:hypothetical protein